MKVTKKAGASSYIDVKLGTAHTTHQVKLNAAALAAFKDANGDLPPGLPIQRDGTPITAPGQRAVGIVGPESTPVEAHGNFGNVILGGYATQDAIESNLGRVLTADEVSALEHPACGVYLF